MRTIRGVAIGLSATFLASAACTGPTSPTGEEQGTLRLLTGAPRRA